MFSQSWQRLKLTAVPSRIEPKNSLDIVGPDVSNREDSPLDIVGPNISEHEDASKEVDLALEFSHALPGPSRTHLCEENSDENMSELEKLRRECDHLRRENAYLKSREFLIEKISSFMSPQLARLVEHQIRNFGCSLPGYRYSNEFKKFCLSVYFIAPAAYAFL